MKLHFEWDEANLNHILNDYPERRNTAEEIESVFYDPFQNHYRFYSNDEVRHLVIGESIYKRILTVIFTVRNGKIRPVSARPTSRRKQLHKEYEKGRSTKL